MVDTRLISKTIAVSRTINVHGLYALLNMLYCDSFHHIKVHVCVCRVPMHCISVTLYVHVPVHILLPDQKKIVSMSCTHLSPVRTEQYHSENFKVPVPHPLMPPLAPPTRPSHTVGVPSSAMSTNNPSSLTHQGSNPGQLRGGENISEPGLGGVGMVMGFTASDLPSAGTSNMPVVGKGIKGEAVMLIKGCQCKKHECLVIKTTTTSAECLIVVLYSLLRVHVSD